MALYPSSIFDLIKTAKAAAILFYSKKYRINPVFTDIFWTLSKNRNRKRQIAAVQRNCAL